MIRWLTCLLAGLAWATTAAAAGTEQTTTGWCSPAISGNSNQVTCQGVDPRAMDRLNELLDNKDLELKQKIAEANEWVRKYNDLNSQLIDTRKQLEAKGEDSTLVQAAQDLLHEGKLDEARKILDRLIASDEANVDRAAEHHFERAAIFALQFDMPDTLPDYAQAYQYRPDDFRYAIEYEIALWRQKDYVTAELVLQRLVPRERALAAQNPAAYRPDLAQTLNNLGVVYDDTHRFAEAEAAFKEAVDLERALATQNPAAYNETLEFFLRNLARLYREMGDETKAKAIEAEAE